jgi:hypothetical protein
VGVSRCDTGVSRRSAPAGWLPGPPRRFADLQRMTADRSCSVGFAAPPASLNPTRERVGGGPWRVSIDRRPVGYPSGWSSTHGLALALEDFVRLPGHPSGAAGSPSRSEGLPPLRFGTPSTLPARGIHFPIPRSRSGAPVESAQLDRNHAVPIRPSRSVRRRRTSSRASTPASVRLRRFPRP